MFSKKGNFLIYLLSKIFGDNLQCYSPISKTNVGHEVSIMDKCETPTLLPLNSSNARRQFISTN